MGEPWDWLDMMTLEGQPETMSWTKWIAYKTGRGVVHSLVYLESWGEAIAKEWNVTDDASLFERLGLPVKIYDAGPSNIKVTTPFDLVIAESLLSRKKD